VTRLTAVEATEVFKRSLSLKVVMTNATQLAFLKSAKGTKRPYHTIQRVEEEERAH
jgi:hypothetical protein